MPNVFQAIVLFVFHLTIFHPIQPFFPTSFPFVATASISEATPTISPTGTATPTETPTATPTPTSTPSATPTPTISVTPTQTASPSPAFSPSPTASPTATPTPTETPVPTATPEPVGNDISYPQCGKTYPTGQQFAIVGINGGIASTTNPCLSSELSWAESTASSSAHAAKIQLYVNTGNPGGLNTVTWPQNNVDPQGNGTSNPYGTCDGSNSIACAWQYGWNRAMDNVVNRFTPAANDAHISNDPADYPWWLDVETVNSWRSGDTESLQANTADLEGMVAYFKSKGVTIGLYSTSFQWGEIVGSLNARSSLNGLPNWLPGASDLAGAKSNCSKAPLTSGGDILLTQYTTGDFDYDYSCK